MLNRQTDRQTSETDFISSSPYPSLLSFLPSTCCTSRRHCNATTCVSTTIFHTTFDQKMIHPHKRGHDENIAAKTKIQAKANTSPHKQPHPAHTRAHAHGSRKLKTTTRNKQTKSQMLQTHTAHPHLSAKLGLHCTSEQQMRNARTFQNSNKRNVEQ